MKFRSYFTPVYFILLTHFLFATRDYESAQANPITIASVNRIVGFIGAYLFLISHPTLRKIRNTPFMQTAYFFYILVAVISSLLFSQWRLYSIWKVMEVSAVFLTSVYIQQQVLKYPFVARQFYELLLNFFKFIIAAAILGILIYPAQAIRPVVGASTMTAFGIPVLPYQLSGTLFQVNANSLGGIAAVILFVTASRILNKRGTIQVFFWCFLSLIVMVLAQSRTAWLGLGMGVVVVLVITKSLNKLVKFFTIILGGVAFGLFSNAMYLYLTRGVSIEQLQGLSGRAGWWEIVFDAYLCSGIFEKLFGLGYMTASRAILSEQLDQSISTLHSDFMDGLISSGILGVAALTASALSMLYYLFRIRKVRHPAAPELIGIGVILFVRMFTGTTIATHNYFLPLFFAVGIYSHTILTRNKTRPLLRQI